MFKDTLEKLLKGTNFNVTSRYGTSSGIEVYRIRYKPNTNNETYVNGHIKNNTFKINNGQTRKNLRGKGIGKQMRALLTLAAKQYGLKRVKQTSAFVENNQRKTHNRPPSSYIMESLGFNRKKSNNNIYKYVYNFSKKTNNKKLIRAAYPNR